MLRNKADLSGHPQSFEEDRQGRQTNGLLPDNPVRYPITRNGFNNEPPKLAWVKASYTGFRIPRAGGPWLPVDYTPTPIPAHPLQEHPVPYMQSLQTGGDVSSMLR